MRRELENGAIICRFQREVRNVVGAFFNNDVLQRGHERPHRAYKNERVAVYRSDLLPSTRKSGLVIGEEISVS